MKILLTLTCVAYIVFSSPATAIMPYSNENSENSNARVNEIYAKLSHEEKLFFIKLAGETTTAGYYSKIKGFSHQTEVNHMRETVERNVRTMQRSGLYSSILRTAGADQQHITRHLEGCRELGRQSAHHANSNNKGRHSIHPGDIYASLYEEEVPVMLPALPHLPSMEQVVRVLSISTLILLTLAAIAGLIGACVCPQLPVFNRVRALLEY